jgi:hypothetical protein
MKYDWQKHMDNSLPTAALLEQPTGIRTGHTVLRGVCTKYVDAARSHTCNLSPNGINHRTSFPFTTYPRIIPVPMSLRTASINIINIIHK